MRSQLFEAPWHSYDVPVIVQFKPIVSNYHTIAPCVPMEQPEEIGKSFTSVHWKQDIAAWPTVHSIKYAHGFKPCAYFMGCTVGETAYLE